MNKRRQLFRLSTMKLSLAAIVFDSIFMAVSVWNETWP
ncbi:holin, partial [Salmonella enterica]|nr:holin [Salmonella enterica]